MLVQLPAVYLYEIYLLDLTHLQKLPSHSYITIPPLAAQFLHHFTPSEQITTSLVQPFRHLGSPILSPFYPLEQKDLLNLTSFYPNWKADFYNVLNLFLNYLKVLQLQAVAAHSYVGILVKGEIPEKFSHCSPFLHANFVLWGRGYLLNSPIAGYCSQFLKVIFSPGVYSPKIFPLQPIAVLPYKAVLVRRKSNCTKLFPLQIYFYTILLPSPGILPHSYKNLHARQNKPTLTKEMGGF